jgi:hypothetical protein
VAEVIGPELRLEPSTLLPNRVAAHRRGDDYIEQTAIGSPSNPQRYARSSGWQVEFDEL